MKIEDVAATIERQLDALSPDIAKALKETKTLDARTTELEQKMARDGGGDPSCYFQQWFGRDQDLPVRGDQRYHQHGSGGPLVVSRLCPGRGDLQLSGTLHLRTPAGERGHP